MIKIFRLVSFDLHWTLQAIYKSTFHQIGADQKKFLIVVKNFSESLDLHQDEDDYFQGKETQPRFFFKKKFAKIYNYRYIKDFFEKN